MLRKLSAIIYRDRIHSDRQRAREIDNSINRSVSFLVLDLFQEGQARLPFGQGDKNITMSFSDNRVHFPITQALASIHDGWSLIDAHPVFELAASIVAPIAFPAHLLAS